MLAHDSALTARADRKAPRRSVLCQKPIVIAASSGDLVTSASATMRLIIDSAVSAVAAVIVTSAGPELHRTDLAVQPAPAASRHSCPSSAAARRTCAPAGTSVAPALTSLSLVEIGRASCR